jgi:hypothetical protein
MIETLWRIARGLSSALTAVCESQLPPMSPTSKPSSPTPSTTPTPTSDDSKSTLEMILSMQREWQETLTTILLGREQPGGPESSTSWNELETGQTFDYDAVPLPSEISGVIDREAEEDLEAQRLEAQMAERRRIEAELAKTRDQITMAQALAADEPGPWAETPPPSVSPEPSLP